MLTFDDIITMCVSLSLAGSCGMAPFLSILVIGILQKTFPSLLDMHDSIRLLLSSTVSLLFLGIMAILQVLASCKAATRMSHIFNSTNVVIVPIMSICATLSTLGMFEYNKSNFEEDDSRERRLTYTLTLSTQFIFQTILITLGIFLSISIHMFRMLIRNVVLESSSKFVLTFIETCICIISVVLVVIYNKAAIGVCLTFQLAAIFNVKKRFQQKHERRLRLIEEAENPEAASESMNLSWQEYHRMGGNEPKTPHQASFVNSERNDLEGNSLENGKPIRSTELC